MTSRLPTLLLAVLCAFATLSETFVQAFENQFDASGQLTQIALGTGWLDVKASVRIPENGWKNIHTADALKTTFLEAGGKKHWQTRFGDGANCDIEITQTVSTTIDGLRFDFVASAMNDSAVEGVLFWIDLPSEIFARGIFESTGKDGATGELPAELFGHKILNSGTLSSIRIFNPDKTIGFAVKFDEPINAAIQDGRQWGQIFSILIHAHEGFLTKGQTVKFGLVLSTSGQPDTSPVEFNVDAHAPRYTIQGLGGNYCFQIDKPEKVATLSELKPQFARTEISLNDWLPTKGGNPTPTAGKIPREFELMRELSLKKIPFIASVWKAPTWMTRTVEREVGRESTVIPPENLADAVDAIGTYLLYAKTNFQCEPDYVSFNEPDYGAQIKFTPESHRDAIKLLGAMCEKLGLKTKCLLGDVSNPRTPLAYLKLAMDDATAMKYVGAVSFHSWGGGTPQEYAAWSDLATSLNRPLIVAEAGVDPGAWKNSTFRSFDYAVREMTHYQNLFQFARPQAVLYWEYTADYSLMSADPKKPGTPVETERFALQKHWLRFIPPSSEALTTTGGIASVLLTAFRKKNADTTTYTFNLSNAAWGRKAKIVGIPAAIKSLNAVQTSRGILFKTLAPIVPVNGIAEMELPEQSLTTLTTMQINE